LLIFTRRPKTSELIKKLKIGKKILWGESWVCRTFRPLRCHIRKETLLHSGAIDNELHFKIFLHILKNRHKWPWTVWVHGQVCRTASLTSTTQSATKNSRLFGCIIYTYLATKHCSSIINISMHKTINSFLYWLFYLLYLYNCKFKINRSCITIF